jgi:hypothetical protein
MLVSETQYKGDKHKSLRKFCIINLKSVILYFDKNQSQQGVTPLFIYTYSDHSEPDE